MSILYHEDEFLMYKDAAISGVRVVEQILGQVREQKQAPLSVPLRIFSKYFGAISLRYISVEWLNNSTCPLLLEYDS